MVKRRHNVVVIAAILLILASICRVPLTEKVRVSFQLAFTVSVTTLLAYIIWWKNKWLAGVLLLSIVSCFYPKLTTNSFIAYQFITSAAVWYAILAYGLKGDWKNILLDAMCIIAICNVGYQIVQMCGIVTGKL